MFYETRFLDNLAPGAVGGPSTLTDVVPLESGGEQRNIVWSEPRQRYSIGLVHRPQAELEALASFFRIMRGRAHGFRFRDLTDYTVSTTYGQLGTSSLGTGALAYSLYKRYTAAGAHDYRRIRKPVSGTVTVYRNASPVTVGAAPGNIAIDYTTGIVTFVPDATDAISAITQANPGKITTGAAHGLSNGQLVYLDGIAGMTQLNGQVVTVTVVDADEFTIGVNTTAYGAYTSGGTVKLGPQPADVLTWAGEFDVPVRLDTDAMQTSVRNAAGGRLVMTWDSIELIELRLP